MAAQSAKVTRTDVAVLLGLVALGALVTVTFGERIGVNHGEGWDGRAYAAWARDFPGQVLDAGVTQYQSLRVLPSAIVYYASALLGVAHTPGHAIAGFQLLDTLALLASAAWLGAIALRLGWSRPASWLAFTAAFLSFANAKHALYSPVLTDPVAFALGMGTIWAYLGRRRVAQWLLALAAAFTWPALMLFSIGCLALPLADAPPAGEARPWQRRLALAIAIGTAAFIVAWLGEEIVRPFPGSEHLLDHTHAWLWPVTIGGLSVYSAFAAYAVARRPETWALAPYLRGLGWRHLAFAIPAIAVILVLRAAWVAHVGRELGIDLPVIQHLYAVYALRGPLWSVVHHVVYFGPVVIVVIGMWPQLAAQCARWGPAAVLGLGLVVVTAVTPESRHLVPLMPFAIVALVAATAERWTARQVIAFALVALVWSKLWLRIGYVTATDPSHWPDLRYTMQHGPWATDATFVAHLVAALVTAALLYRSSSSRITISSPG